MRRKQLTKREREVVQLMSQGGTNREIGTALGISAATVKKHAERIYRKLNVLNRTAAAANHITSRKRKRRRVQKAPWGQETEDH